MLICPKCSHQIEELEDLPCSECGWDSPVKQGIPCFSPESGEGDGTYNVEFFGELADLEEGNFWFQSRNRLIGWCLGRFFPPKVRLMEIGCGTGFVLKGLNQQYSGLDSYGSELFVEGILFAKERLPETKFFQADVLKMPFQEHFDVIGAFDVLEHIEEDELAMSNLFKAVRPGGGVIVSVPQHMFLWGHMDELGFHKRRYNRRELVDKIQRAGFEVKYVSSFVSLLLPVMWLSRFSKRKSTDVMEELRIGSFTNACLKMVMTAEYFLLTKLRLSLPAGGSLLLVAQKNS